MESVVESKVASTNNFDFIRFTLASLVVFSHSYPLATGDEKQEPLMLLSGGQLTLGALAVNCFFIISGYLIAQSWSKKPRIRPFLSKRIRRIYPGFILASVLCAFVIAPLFPANGAEPVITPRFAMEFFLKLPRLLFVQPAAAFPTNPAPGAVNGSLWSIPFEFWCYIGLMAAGLSGLLTRPRLLTCAWVGSIVVSFVVAWYDLRIGGKFFGVIFGYPTFWARLTPYFLAGMVFFSFGDRLKLTGRGALAASLLFGVACAFPYAVGLVLPLTATYLILWLAFLPTTAISNFARHGDFSYGIYLYAFPIEQMVAHWLGHTLPCLLFACAWPLSVAAGALSWHGLEKHFMRSAARSPVSAHALTGLR